MLLRYYPTMLLDDRKCRANMRLAYQHVSVAQKKEPQMRPMDLKKTEQMERLGMY